MDFEEIDRRDTPMGVITVRRRHDPGLLVDVYEVKLGDEFLMSSLFTASEIALAHLGLDAVEGDRLDVIVGGLGLGYTAHAVLEDPRVRSLRVVEALDAVIAWHADALLPDAAALTGDPRCELVEGDFFALVAAGAPFAAGAPECFHAVLVDIDHSPRHTLHPSHEAFYTPQGLGKVAARLHPGGVFGLWSDDPPDDAFTAAAEQVFSSCEAHVVSFPNPYTGGESACTVYVARR